MSTPKNVDRTRRNLVIGTAAASGVAGIAAAVPFVDSMNPSERAKAMGAPVEADITGILPGQLLTFEWLTHHGIIDDDLDLLKISFP